MPMNPISFYQLSGPFHAAREWSEHNIRNDFSPMRSGICISTYASGSYTYWQRVRGCWSREISRAGGRIKGLEIARSADN